MPAILLVLALALQGRGQMDVSATIVSSLTVESGPAGVIAYTSAPDEPIYAWAIVDGEPVHLDGLPRTQEELVAVALLQRALRGEMLAAMRLPDGQQ